jgi:hypothetical protein
MHTDQKEREMLRGMEHKESNEVWMPTNEVEIQEFVVFF